MMHLKLFISTFLLLASITFARVDGPFALYTKSSDPSFNKRVISIGARNPYAFLADPFSSPSEIPSSDFNFYLNTTINNEAPFGELVWEAQPPYARLFGRINIVDVTSPIQPIFYDYNEAIQGYSVFWNFTAGKQLLLGNQSKFYARLLDLPMYHSPAVYWLFGSKNQNINATAVTIWRLDH